MEYRALIVVNKFNTKFFFVEIYVTEGNTKFYATEWTGGKWFKS